jgi:tRNA-2-methylthio-N6-dimethylallyladenosine synthase
VDQVEYDFAYMFHYSERPGTLAAKKFTDDISLDIKKRRLEEIISKQTAHSLKRNQQDVGKVFKVLIEGESKRSKEFLQGRNSQNKVVIFPRENKTKGMYVNVFIERCTGATLIGKIVE